MATSANSSHHWLSAAILLPLLLLAGLALLGLGAQERLAWDEAREQARRSARATATLMAVELSRRVTSVPDFPDPPVPGSASPLDAVLDGEDPLALAAVRDDPAAGLSPAGLPRRALAAMRLRQLDANSQAADDLVKLVTVDAPSVLTERLLQELGLEEDPVLRTWKQAQLARRLLREHASGGWIPGGESLVWVGKSEDSTSFIPREAYDAAVDAALRVGDPSYLTKIVVDGADEGSNPLASAAIDFGDGLRAQVSLSSADVISKNVRRQQGWTLALLAAAIGVSTGGVVLVQRSLSRERKLNEMKSQFVAGVSHELRAPVASIRLMADALEQGKVAPETAKEFHRLIALEGARLSTLVANVLDHSRISQDGHQWRLEPCDLSALVADTLGVMRPLAKERRIVLLDEIAPVESAVDKGAIQQALVNLLDNAIKFSPPGSTVTVTLSIGGESGRWELRVRDEGPGIPRDEQKRIFERFYRPGDELRRETQGTGIGLSLVMAIARGHRGTIHVESQPGKGSTFILRIPIS
jgi:signal transduction histidine kinase